MKQPKLKNLKINAAETKKIRAAQKNKKSVKITINIDAETLTKVRKISKETGVPYQRLINKLLSESLERKAKTESRLDRLEKELNKLKDKLAA
jgi:predicted DNA binding CopG/RHH family protein